MNFKTRIIFFKLSVARSTRKHSKRRVQLNNRCNTRVGKWWMFKRMVNLRGEKTKRSILWVLTSVCLNVAGCAQRLSYLIISIFIERHSFSGNPFSQKQLNAITSILIRVATDAMKLNDLGMLRLYTHEILLLAGDAVCIF